jgi:hypothetical protein
MLNATGARLLLCFGAALLVWSCAAVKPAPVVEHRTMRIPKGALNKVAVLPVHPAGGLLRREPDGPGSANAAADLIGRFITEALVRRGIAVVTPTDLSIAFSSQGIGGSQITPKVSPRVAAEIAAREFGATAVLYGEVTRWRERGGEAYGTTKPASVAFHVRVYSAPVPHQLWNSKFDETQRPLSENVWNAPRYPGGGSRWLTASELARWGVDSAIDTLPSDI